MRPNYFGSVSLIYLLHLQFVALISPWNIVAKRLWSDKVMVRGGCSNDIPLASDLTSKSRHRARHYSTFSSALLFESSIYACILACIVCVCVCVYLDRFH